MLPSKQRLSDLLGALYEAAANPDLWDIFLQRFALLAGASSAGLLVHDFQIDGHNVTNQFGLNDDDVRIYYNQSPETEDIWTSNARRIIHPGWIGVSESLCSQGVLLRSPFYNECLSKLDIMYGMFGVIEHTNSVLANISIYRNGRSDAFDQPDLELLRFAMPHLRRAFQLHFRLTDLQTRNTSLQAAVDMMPTAMIFFESSAKILCINRSASNLLAMRDGLLSTRDGLRAEHPTESAHLEQLIQRAIATSNGKGLDPGGAASISRKLRAPLHVVVIPVRNLNLDMTKGASAVVFVVDPEQKLRPKAAILSGLFGLTPAECRVALLLGDGRPLPEIGSILGVTRNTLKSQVASVYAKTGTSRQSQLARLLAQFPQVVEPPGTK